MKIKDRIKSLRRVRAGDLLPNPKNWRKHPDAQANALRGILAEVGWADAALVRETKDGLMLIDGHLRAEVAPDEKIPVLILDVDDEEAEKILATHDPLTGLAEADKERLDSLLSSLEFENEDLQAMLDQLASDSGIAPEAKELEDPEPQIDKADELLKAWDVKPGQLWEIKGRQTHRLLCGDSTKAEDVARVMGGEKAGMMNTDPPYGVDYAAVKNGIPRSGFRNIQERRGDIENDDLTSGPELQTFLESAIKAAVPHLTYNPAFYLWHPMLTQGTFFAAAAAADILIHRQIIWVKPNMVLTRSGMYHWKHELCFYGWIRGKPCPWYGDKSQVSVWELGESVQGRMHGTQKPVELFARPIPNHLRYEEICYEPFAGSGSQFLAAEQMRVRCYGIEIEPKYCAVILERMAALDCKCSLVGSKPTKRKGAA